MRVAAQGIAPMVRINQTSVLSWTLFKSSAWTFFKSSAALTLLGVSISAGLAVKQWLDSPIAIRPFTVAEGAGTAGISAAALADETKAHISAIYSESGDLFQTRKLGEPTIPLDVKIGDTGWNLESLAGALGIPLTSADVSGRIVQDGKVLILQWTTVKPGGVEVDNFSISGADISPLANVDEALACLALRTVAGLSPDVAANYLHKQDEAGGSNSDRKKCIAQDDVELYSQVSKDEALPPAARVNALVGLSVHFSYFHQLFEELSMAEAATHLASRALSCDDTHALPSRWQRIKCRASAYSPFSDKNLRAEVAAWMQLGAARSDYAAAAPTLKEMNDRRKLAIEAYDHVIAIKGDYALAYDAKGLQHSLLNETDEAARAFGDSLRVGETSPAHVDLGLLFIHGRNDSFNERDIQAHELLEAGNHFSKAVELSPDYWDAYGGWGYVLYKAGKLREAADVLEAAVQHDESNRSLRLLLGSVYAGLCRFDAAKASFQSAYDAHVNNDDTDNALNIMSDWGKALDGFGLPFWAIAQESEVLAAKPTHVNALRVRGEMEIETSGMDPAVIAAGLSDLKAAIDNDSSKTDAVLSAYLEGLMQTDRADDAVAAYQTWSRDGLVPPLATTSTYDAAILPAAPNTRLAYAKALLKNNQWQSASREFAVLVQLGVRPGARESAELRARAANAVTDDAILTPVSMMTDDAVLTPVSMRMDGTPVAARPESKHECSLPTATLPLLTHTRPFAVSASERTQARQPYATRSASR
jgi:tetratricopeptide (TPR) repeat protein